MRDGGMLTRFGRHMTEALAATLGSDERDAVLGDLAERRATAGQAFGDVLGLVARRQAALWLNWRPWLALAGVIVPCSALLSLYSRMVADGGSIYLWLYVNNWDWSLLEIGAFRPYAPAYVARVLLSGLSAPLVLAYLTLPCWSWNAGIALARLSRRTVPVTGSLFCLALGGEMLGVPRLFGAWGGDLFASGRDYPGNAAVFAIAFYRVVFPVMVQAVLVIVPAIAGMRQALRWTGLRPIPRALLSISAMLNFLSIASLLWFPWVVRHANVPAGFWDGPVARCLQLMLVFVYWPIAYLPLRASARLLRGGTVRAAALLAVASIATAADPAAVRATLQPAADRKPAPAIQLKDSAGKTVTLKKYRGKVVLLDFWATWCHGCKEEIPWFAEFQRRYAGQGLRVIGVSLDDQGWKAVKPFLRTAAIPYRIVLGDDSTARTYGIEAMPDTFLIDRQGRIAAAYTGVVDRENVEANLRTMLGQR
jgi:peroxiredoxin